MKAIQSLLVSIVVMTLVACSGNNKPGTDSIELSGAGATFPLPFYNMAFEAFSNLNGGIVSYGGIGSGGGVRNLKDQIVDFAGSDAYLTDNEMTSMNPVVHIPTCMGAVVLAYNLPGIKQLNLTEPSNGGTIHVW